MKVVSKNDMHRDDVFKKIALEDVSFENGMIRVKKHGEEVYAYSLAHVKEIRIEEPI